MSKFNYIESELSTVAPLPVLEGKNGQFRLKLHSELGETKWLNITDEQFRKIEDVLLGVSPRGELLFTDSQIC